MAIVPRLFEVFDHFFWMSGVVEIPGNPNPRGKAGLLFVVSDGRGEIRAAKKLIDHRRERSRLG